MVFDGGINCSTTVAPINPVPGWMKFGVVDGLLVVCKPMNSEKGLMYLRASDNHPRFVLLPRKHSIGINPDGKMVCRAMASLSKMQSNLVRGASKTVFGREKYCSVGAKPRRNAPGVEPGIFIVDGSEQEKWDCVVTAVKRCEHAVHAYVD